jgi:hypothetical protein
MWMECEVNGAGLLSCLRADCGIHGTEIYVIRISKLIDYFDFYFRKTCWKPARDIHKCRVLETWSIDVEMDPHNVMYREASSDLDR